MTVRASYNFASASERDFGAEAAMHPLGLTVGLWMIQMRAHIRHAGRLHELRSLAADELRSRRTRSRAHPDDARARSVCQWHAVPRTRCPGRSQ